MSLNLQEILKIAHLARLDITTKDAEALAQELSNILDFVAQMQAVNTDHVTPLYNVHTNNQRLRDDIVTEKNQRDELQKIAPLTEAGLYLVPAVIEE